MKEISLIITEPVDPNFVRAVRTTCGGNPELAQRLMVMDFFIRTWGRSRKISFQEMVKEAAKSDSAMSDWMIEVTFGQPMLDLLNELRKVDPVRASGNTRDMDVSDALVVIHGKEAMSKTIDGYRARINDVIMRVKRLVKQKYVTRRNLKTGSNRINTGLTPNEVRRCEETAYQILESLDEYKHTVNNSNTASFMKSPLDDYALNIKYRLEKFKEFFCNVFRVTPESFDAFYDAIETATKKRIDNPGDHIENWWQNLAENVSDDKMTASIKEYGHLLVKTDLPDDVPTYVSKFTRTVDKEETKKIQDSLRKYGGDKSVMEIWSSYRNSINGKEKDNRNTVITGKKSRTFYETPEAIQVIKKEHIRGLAERAKLAMSKKIADNKMAKMERIDKAMNRPGSKNITTTKKVDNGPKIIDITKPNQKEKKEVDVFDFT